MKKVTHFICEICGTEYADKEKARVCEKKHATPKEIVGQVYHPIRFDESGYPRTIDVKMSDGKTLRYKRLRVNEDA